VLQANPQLVPSQVAVPFIGVEHSMHDVPHVFGLMSGWQIPEQSWLPPGQTPAHEALSAMQAPAHSFFPEGQSPPHIVPSQVAVPPVGTGHAVQLEPQEPTKVLLTHDDPQAWKPGLQDMPHAVPSQVAVPWAGIGQAVQDVPQVFGLAFG
jgi:hypothetical protein